MNNSSENIEFLTAKLLDGTISDDEYRQIEHLINSQPEFAQNLTELTRLEDLLKSLHRVEPTITPGLLESVEHSVSAMINTGAAATYGAAVVGKSILGYAAGAIGVAVIAGVSYWAATSYFQPGPLPNVQTPVVAERQIITETQSLDVEAQRPTESITTKSEQPSESDNLQNTIAKAQNLPQNQSHPENVVQPTANSNVEINAPANTERLLKDIKSYSELYSQAIAANNQIDAADNAKNLGLLYGKLNDIDQARAYFGRSVTAAHTTGIAEAEAEAYGQWGIMEAKAGYTATAKEYLNKAIRLLSGINAPSSKWRTHLDKLNSAK